MYCVTQPFINQRDNVLSILSNIQIFLVMFAALVLKYQPSDGSEGSSFDEKGLGVFLIVLNVSGGLTMLIIGFFRFFVPDWGARASELATRGFRGSSILMNAFAGRDSSGTTGGGEVGGHGIELGSVAIIENPMVEKIL